MKFLVTARPGTIPIKIKHGVRLFQAAKDWANERLADGTFDCHYACSDLGGISVTNADSHEAVQDLILDCPLYPYFNWEVTALCDANHSYDKNTEYFKKLGG
jgi:muconolactone delta-isomerase